MKKRVIIFIILLALGRSIYSQDYKVTKQEIEQFLSFADNYLKNVSNLLSDEEKKLKLDEIMYLENEELIEKTMYFLEKKGWNLEKMDNFLYVVATVLNYFELWEKYNIPKEEQVIEDISEDTIVLIKKYRQKLLKYITITEMNDELQDNLETEENTMINNSTTNTTFKDYVGEYKMNIINNTKFGFADRIVIKSIEDSFIKGEITIDWDIGPQARMPSEWERIYSYTWNAKINGNNIKFNITVAEEYEVATEYEFDLYLEKQNSKPIIKGRLKTKVIKSGYVSNYTIKAEKINL